ncbi:BSD domain protein [Talaromyces stipitatus ATCC 10500]|uniref:BSD domain protein n=1 Tax=Talaromyces stipitatus (strain ATCC 10500 / CBS 375.48 / QM 6759 / NRRL 1006) TaxID=441959 RepID=B8M068_TALSN|nr:BSD domain protein [Talaromyces stipitatus ATCC 10500]EED21165.1 BSD domain protein [Talaromyces stipitatus ATCC 10500]
MDFAYDHIQEEILASRQAEKNEDGTQQTESQNINLGAEFEETFRAFSNSPWGAKIGGLWSNVRKQGESYYEGARQEYAAVSEEATKGFSDLRDSIVDRTKGISLGGALSAIAPSNETTTDESIPKAADKENKEEGELKDQAQTEEGESFISRFRAEAAKRLKEIERAEDAADEALVRFGTNIRSFLRDAVSIAPPEQGSDKVLFESKDSEGKRVFHATRLEAQLHAIHTNLEGLKKDPDSEQWTAFKKDFNVESKTDDITKDLEQYPELRRAMEKLVPETVDYSGFWSRYYFLRLAVETEEQKRKELLKGANTAADEEEVGWDEDSDSESPSTPHVKSKPSAASSQNLTVVDDSNLLSEPRRSNDQHSQPDSESSYDVVSGATSQTPASPREKPAANTSEDSDEDWE